MSRAVLSKTNLIVAAIVAVVGIGGGTALVVHERASSVHLTTNTQHQLTEITYHGKNGVDALTLLKQQAIVKTKHYAFGDIVVAINGSNGNGPKYWTFYVNSKMSEIGAGAYQTKNSDVLEWKLEQL